MGKCSGSHLLLAAMLFYMKYLLIALMVFSFGCDMGPRFDEEQYKFYLKADTIPFKNIFDSSNFAVINKSMIEYYDIMINSPQKGRVAYKKRDSAWVVLDSAETFK